MPETGSAVAQDIAYDCDVAIIGSGIAGGMLAAILARHGVNVMVFEAASHPKFAIGESMILETSEIMRSLASIFDVPELEYFSAEHFLPYIGSTHGVKRHFSYLHHVDGQQQNPKHVLQAVIPGRPYGHELHIYRQDSDYFYAGLAVGYGARLLSNTPVSDLDIDKNKVCISTKSGKQYFAKCVIDAGGFRSIIADKYQLRDFGQRTHTRGIFTHMINVPSYHNSGATRSAMGIPYSLAEGTLHHIFSGGWMWVIPFNNHPDASNPFCSVGLMLDPRQYPQDKSLTGEQEFWDFVGRHPGMRQHLQGADAVRSWVSAGRIQYSSKRIAGDRYCLLGHAAGFIDPLFSKGLYTTLASLLPLGQALLKAHREDDYSAQQFSAVERCTLDYVAANDRLVANAIKSFTDPRLWQQYSVLWILGAYLELVKLTTTRMQWLSARQASQSTGFEWPELRLVGGGFARYKELAEQVDQIIEQLDTNDRGAVTRSIQQLRSLYRQNRWISYSFRQLADGKNHLPNSKFTWRLLMTEGGILGPKDYREHFFQDISLARLSRFMLSEKRRYSRQSIAGRHLSAFRDGGI